jgi:hypothetical protein
MVRFGCDNQVAEMECVAVWRLIREKRKVFLDSSVRFNQILADAL